MLVASDDATSGSVIAEAGADLAGQQRLQPSLFVLGSAVALEHFHVAGVGRRAVEDLGRHHDAAHDLAQRRVFEIGEAGAALALGQEQIPQSGGARLRLQLLDDRDGLPAVACSISS